MQTQYRGPFRAASWEGTDPLNLPPISTCGAIVDWLRKCYSTTMSFARDGSQVCPIRWYFTPPGAPVLPFSTPFRSLNWWHQDEGPDDVLGEQIDVPRPIANGLPILQVQNEVPCGTAEQWHDGFETAIFPPGATVYGTNDCCGLPPEPFTHFACVNCEAGAWSQYTAYIRGADPVGPMHGSNGNWTLTYQGGCTWRGPDFELLAPFAGVGRWLLVVRSTSEGVLAIERPGHLLAPVFRWTAGWDCLTTFSVPLNPPDPFFGSPTLGVLLPGDAAGRGPFCPAQGAFLPSDLLVRCPRGGIGVGGRLAAQDAPLDARGPCQYGGIIRWETGRFPTFAIPAFRPLSLEFLAGDLAVLLGRTIYGFQFRYQGICTHPWDLTPIPLLFVDGPTGGGFPPVLTLYTQDDLPP